MTDTRSPQKQQEKSVRTEKKRREESIRKSKQLENTYC